MTALSYGRVVTELATRAPDRVAAVVGKETLTRAALEGRANQMARAFAERGVRHGDFVTIALPNSPALLVACLATWKLGAVPNPISHRLPAPERNAILERARPALLVGCESEPPGEVPALAASYQPAADTPDDALEDRTPPHERAMASGGSTGQPKLIVAASPAAYDPERASPLFKARAAVLVPGPLYHAAPFSAAWQGIFAGCKVVVMERFDAGRFLALVEEHRVDRVTLVPTMMLRIWRHPEREGFDVSSLEFVMTGGAPCPAWLMRGFIDWLGADVMHEAFGPSERIGGTFITGREWLEHPGSVGRPASGARIRILGEDGADLPTGEVGEIFMMPAAGPGTTYRYVGAEARRTDGGWESVGDMGRLDADGYLYLADRKSDMILCGGRNVYPAEIEGAIDAHGDVRSSAVIGLPDEDLGQRLHAIVELAEPPRDEEAASAALLAHLATHLVAYKLPQTFEFVTEPLRDDAGKVRRPALRAARTPDPSPSS